MIKKIQNVKQTPELFQSLLGNWKLFLLIWCIPFSVNQNGMEEWAGKRKRTNFDHSFFNWQVDKFFWINFIGETFLCMWSFLVNENSAFKFYNLALKYDEITGEFFFRVNLQWLKLKLPLRWSYLHSKIAVPLFTSTSVINW